MTELNDKYQQQILFEEEHVANEKSAHSAQIVFENQDWQPDEQLFNNIDEVPEEKSKPRWLWRIIAGLLSTIIVIETVAFFTTGFAQTPIVASLYAALLLAFVITGGAVLIRELSGLRQLKKQQQLQGKTSRLMAGDRSSGSGENNPFNAQAICEKISAQLPCDLLDEQEQQWADIVIEDYNDAELLGLYSRLMLTKVDQKAVAEIAKFSSESVVLIALSPLAIIDMLIMLMRNLRLIDKIASLYGLKLGYWSRIKLIKQVLINMFYAGASELVTDFGADMLGADMLGKLSGRLAQGLGAGLLTARLGLKALKLCRPIPFNNDAPKLGHIRKEIISQIKQLTLNNLNSG